MTTQRTLHLAVKAEYFHEMKAGTKTREYRLQNDFWRARLENREYDAVRITLGYPKRDNHERIIMYKWQGYECLSITHKHFGEQPVNVFAIVVEERVPLI